MLTIQERINALEKSANRKRLTSIERAVALEEKRADATAIKELALAELSEIAVAAYEEGKTLLEVTFITGLHTKRLREMLVENGVKIRSGGPHAKSYVTSARDLAVVKRRTENATYQEIGNEFSLTRERIRQILMRAHPELCGPREIRVETRICLSCSGKFEVAPSWPAFTCSRKCGSILRHQNYLARNKKHVDVAVKMRRKKISWAEIAKTMNVSSMTIYRYVSDAWEAGQIKNVDRVVLFPNGGGLHK